MVRVLMSYPDAMRREIDRKGIAWWAKGGEYESFAEAVEIARGVAEEKNFPIQVTCLGQKMVVYPSSIGY